LSESRVTFVGKNLSTVTDSRMRQAARHLAQEILNHPAHLLCFVRKARWPRTTRPWPRLRRPRADCVTPFDVSRDRSGGRAEACSAVACDGLRRRALFFNCGCHGRGNLADILDVALIAVIASTACSVAFCTEANLLADLVGRLGGLIGEALHLVGDNGKALAGVAGARGFDGGIERKQIGLARNAVDQVGSPRRYVAPPAAIADDVAGVDWPARPRSG